METLLAAWKAFVAWFPDVYKTMFAFIVISGCLLFFPWSWLVAMHVESVANSYRPAEWLVFALFTILLSLHWGDKGLRSTNEWFFLNKRLKRLTPFEADTVSTLLSGRSVIAWPYEERILYLHGDGIIKQIGIDVANGQFSYMLERRAERAARKMNLGPTPIK
jgi:hypothetical protein